MNIFMFLAPLAGVVMLMLPLVSVYRRATTGQGVKFAVGLNVCGFFGICILGVVLSLSGMVSAEAAQGIGAVVDNNAGMGYLAAALSTGLSAIGAGVAVAAAAPAAIGAFSENPKSFAKALIFVAMGEGVALYGLLISILLINAIG